MVRRISLGLSVLVLVMFFLPWVAVTCAGEEIMTATGLEMVTGFDYEAPGEAGEASPEVLAIAILVIGLIGAGAYFLRGKSGAMSRGIFAALGIIFLLALKFKIDSNIEKESQGMLQASYLPGFWIMSISFVTAAILNFLHFVGLRRIRVETYSESLSPVGTQTPEAAQEPVLAVTSKASQEISCPKCGILNSGGAKFCQNCGAELQPVPAEKATPVPLYCSNCGTENNPDAKFCQNCGKSLVGN